MLLCGRGRVGSRRAGGAGPWASGAHSVQPGCVAPASSRCRGRAAPTDGTVGGQFLDRSKAGAPREAAAPADTGVDDIAHRRHHASYTQFQRRIL